MKRLKTLKLDPDTGEVVGKIKGETVLPLSVSDEKFCVRKNLKISRSIPIDSVYFALPLIAEFLTGYDAHQFSQVNKLVHSEINEYDVWYHILTRDYPLFVHGVTTEKRNVKLSLLRLEYGEECHECACSIPHICRRTVNLRQAQTLYKLSRNELSHIPCTTHKHVVYNTPVYNINTNILRRKTMVKYRGNTNFQIHLLKSKADAEKRRQSRIGRDTSIQNWMLEIHDKEVETIREAVDLYRLSMSTDSVLNTEAIARIVRTRMLEDELAFYGMERREDSALAETYIDGMFSSVKFAGAFLYMTHLLFSYNYVAFSEFHMLFKTKIRNRLYNMRNKPLTTQLCKKVVDNIHDKLRSRLKHYG